MASDIFSLGVLLVELLCDRRIERGADDSAQPVAVPSQWAGADCPWRRRLRGDLDAIAARACALEPARRYSSVEALANDVQRYLDHRAVAARQGSRLYRSGRALRRHWQAACVAGAVLGLSVGFVWRLGEERARAQQEAQVAEQVGQFMLSAFEAADPRKRGKGEVEASAREVLDAGVARIDAELDGSPAIRARVQQVIGLAYQNIGQPQKAEELLRAAVDGLLADGVDEPLLAADAMSDLATMQANSRRGPEAEATARRALVLVERHAEPSGTEAAHAWNSLGLALMEQERFDEAEVAMLHSLEMRRALPEAARMTAVATHNLGLLYRRRGDLARSEAALNDALAMKRELHGERSYEMLSTRHVLAMTLNEQGRLREAEALQRQNLALALDLFGEASDHTATAYNELASLSQDLGEYPQAAQYYARALEVEAEVAGEQSMSYMVTLNNLATLEESRGDTGRALELFRRSFEYRRDSLGPDNPSALRAEVNLGRALMRVGRLDEAEPLIARALSVWSSRLEPDGADLLRTRLGWAEWQIRAGRFQDAQATLEAMRPLVEGKPPVLVFRHQLLVAELLQRQQRNAEALDAWALALSQAEAQYGAESISTARWRVPYAEVLLQAGQAEQARVQVRRAAQVLRAQLVPGSEIPRRLDALEAGLGMG